MFRIAATHISTNPKIFLADPRTNDWPLIKSPVPGLTIIGLYLYFVNSWGPRYMKDRKPYQFKNTLIIYNFIQVIISFYLFFEVSSSPFHISLLFSGLIRTLSFASIFDEALFIEKKNIANLGEQASEVGDYETFKILTDVPFTCPYLRE